jgi:hypothetical protein
MDTNLRLISRGIARVRPARSFETRGLPPPVGPNGVRWRWPDPLPTKRRAHPTKWCLVIAARLSSGPAQKRVRKLRVQAIYD